MDQETRNRVSKEIAEAAKLCIGVGEELDGSEGSEWVDLMSLMYLCLADLVASGGTPTILSLEQAQRLAAAHALSMRSWGVVEEFIKAKNAGKTDDEVQNSLDLKDFGDAEGKLWNLCPSSNAIKCMLPPKLWPDHPAHERNRRR